MTYKASASSFRLGHSISWNSSNSPYLFYRQFRLCLVFNVLLKGFLKYHKMKIIKWVFFAEMMSLKLLIFLFINSHPATMKVKFRKRSIKFSFWNKLYHDRLTQDVKRLFDYYSKKKFKTKVRLGCGRLWHKIFKTVFYFLGKRALHRTKLYKSPKRKVEKASYNRTYSLIMKKKNNKFLTYKRASFPQYQWLFLFNFRFLKFFQKRIKTSKSVFLSFIQNIVNINYYINEKTSRKNNKKLRKFHSMFENASNKYYDFFFFRRIPHNIHLFDYFSFIQGLDSSKHRGGRLSPTKLKTYNKSTPWSTIFIKGFYAKHSLKKVARKWSINYTVKTKIRQHFLRFVIKNLFFSDTRDGRYVFKTKNYFFYKKFGQRLLQLVNKFSKTNNKNVVKSSNDIITLELKNILQKKKIKKKLINRPSQFDFTLLVKYGRYFNNPESNSFVDKYNFLRHIRNSFLSIRRSFFKKWDNLNKVSFLFNNPAIYSNSADFYKKLYIIRYFLITSFLVKQLNKKRISSKYILYIANKKKRREKKDYKTKRITLKQKSLMPYFKKVFKLNCFLINVHLMNLLNVFFIKLKFSVVMFYFIHFRQYFKQHHNWIPFFIWSFRKKITWKNKHLRLRGNVFKKKPIYSLDAVKDFFICKYFGKSFIKFLISDFFARDYFHETYIWFAALRAWSKLGRFHWRRYKKRLRSFTFLFYRYTKIFENEFSSFNIKNFDNFFKSIKLYEDSLKIYYEFENKHRKKKKFFKRFFKFFPKKFQLKFFRVLKKNKQTLRVALPYLVWNARFVKFFGRRKRPCLKATRYQLNNRSLYGKLLYYNSSKVKKKDIWKKHVRKPFESEFLTKSFNFYTRFMVWKKYKQPSLRRQDWKIFKRVMFNRFAVASLLVSKKESTDLFNSVSYLNKAVKDSGFNFFFNDKDLILGYSSSRLIKNYDDHQKALDTLKIYYSLLKVEVRKYRVKNFRTSMLFSLHNLNFLVEKMQEVKKDIFTLTILLENFKKKQGSAFFIKNSKNYINFVKMLNYAKSKSLAIKLSSLVKLFKVEKINSKNLSNVNLDFIKYLKNFSRKLKKKMVMVRTKAKVKRPYIFKGTGAVHTKIIMQDWHRKMSKKFNRSPFFLFSKNKTYRNYGLNFKTNKQLDPKNLKWRKRVKYWGRRVGYFLKKRERKILWLQNLRSIQKAIYYRKLRKKYYIYYVPLKKWKTPNLPFPKKVRKAFFNPDLWLSNPYSVWKLPKYYWLKKLSNWYYFMRKSYKVNLFEMSNDLVENLSYSYSFLQRYRRYKLNRGSLRNWKMNRLYFYSHIYWSKSKIRYGYIKSMRDRMSFYRDYPLAKSAGIPLGGYRRVLRWKNYKLIFNRFIRMHLGVSNKFYRRYRVLRRQKMSLAGGFRYFYKIYIKNYLVSRQKQNALIKKNIKKRLGSIQLKLRKIAPDTKYYSLNWRLNFVRLYFIYFWKMRMRFLEFSLFLRDKLLERKFKKSLVNIKGVMGVLDHALFNKDVYFSLVKFMEEKNWFIESLRIPIEKKKKLFIETGKFTVYKKFFFSTAYANFDQIRVDTSKYLYNILIFVRNTKKLIFINKVIKALIQNTKKRISLKFYKIKKNLVLEESSEPMNYYKCFLLSKYVSNDLMFWIFRKKNFWFFDRYGYSMFHWMRNKKFLFWLECQLEKIFKFNIKLIYVDAIKSFIKLHRWDLKKFVKFTERINYFNMIGGWREQIYSADMLWIILLSVKYYSSSFFTDMLAEQIVKRKKHWGFIRRMRMCLNVFLRFAGLYKRPFVVDGIRISVNGKINGRDRSINHLIFKTSLKDNQLTKIDWLCLKVDYSCIQAKSRYGSFALRVWISRI